MKKIYNKLSKFLIWWLTFSIGAFLALKVTLSVTVPYKFIAILLAGLIIEAVSKIMQVFKYKSEIHLNRVLLFWILIHSLSYLLMYHIVIPLIFSAMILQVLLMGLGITLITYFIWKVKIKTRSSWIASIIVLFIVLFYSTNGLSENQPDVTYSSNQNSILGSGKFVTNLVNLVKESFSKMYPLRCPQLPLFLNLDSGERVISNGEEEITLKCPGNAPCVHYGEYSPFTSVSMLTKGVWTSPSAYIICRDAKYEGENRDYIYCDLGGHYRDAASYFEYFTSGDDDSIPYIVKKLEEQGEIIEKQNIIRKSFINIYTKEGQFVKTVCGKDPEEIIKERESQQIKEFKQAVDDLDELFS